MKLGIIVGSTRQNRQTIKQARWVAVTARLLEGVEVEVLDLADYPMPFFAEPISPRFNPNRDIDPIAQKWLDKLAEQDAYVVVTPEYNHSIPGVLKNALDYVDFQLNRKPSAIVSHGAVGGARAAMHLKEILSEGKTVPIPNFVAMSQRIGDVIDEEGNLAEPLKSASYGPQTTLEAMLAELKWYSDALETPRGNLPN
jgi:NAD(P)H-dependent FMN reductase